MGNYIISIVIRSAMETMMPRIVTTRGYAVEVDREEWNYGNERKWVWLLVSGPVS